VYGIYLNELSDGRRPTAPPQARRTAEL